MRKVTKNKIIHGILIIFVIIIALLASMVAAFRDVTLQTMVARSIAGELSKRLNTEVKIRTFYITYDLGIVLEDVQIDDLYGCPLFRVGKLYAKVSPTIMPDELRVKDIYLEDVWGNVVKYEGAERLNIMELFGQMGGGGDTEADTDEGLDIRFRIDNMKLDNGRVVYWDQNRDRPEKLSMDWFHIDIDSIYAVITDLEIKHDTIMWNVHSLKGQDRCGLVLDDANGDVLFCEKCLNIDDLMLETGESKVDLDMRFEYEQSSAYYEFEDSVRIIGNIRESTLKLSDLRYFSWVLDRMPDKFVFTAYFDGKVSDFTVKNFDARFGENSHIDADVAFKGLPEFFTSYMDINFRNLRTTYNDVDNFAIPIESVTVPMPSVLDDVEVFELTGFFKGYPDDFNTQFNLQTDIGNMDIYVYLNTTEDSEYIFNIDADNINLQKMFDMDEESEVTFEFGMDGKGLEVETSNFKADVAVESLKIMGNEFDSIDIHADYGDSRLLTDFDIKHPLINLDWASVIDFKDQDKLGYKVSAKVKNADLVKLNLVDYDKTVVVSSDIDLDIKGDNLDDIVGSVALNNTSYFNGELYTMDYFNGSINEISGIKDIAIDCDFFDFNGTGIISSGTFVEAFKNTARDYIHIPAWYDREPTETDKQEFSISLNLKDTRQLMHMFMPDLYVSSGTTINATYTTEYPYHGCTVESPEIVYNDMRILDLDIRNTARYNEYVSLINLSEIIIRDTSEQYSERLGLENLTLHTVCSNDTVNFDLFWDDYDDVNRNKAHLKSTFIPYEKSGGLLKLKAEELVVNDTVWNLHPMCNIDFQKDRIGVNYLMLYTGTQSMAFNGYVPMHSTDTLVAVLNDVDVSDFDFVVNGSDINFDGMANGIVRMSGLSETMSFITNLELANFYLNNQEVGDVSVTTSWHDSDKSIHINTELYNSLFGDEKHEAVKLVGSYYPLKTKDNLKFDLDFDAFKLATLSPFISNVVKRMSGHASGNVKVRGSIKEPEILGKVVMNNAGCLVNYMNTYFTFSDTITMKKDRIVFNDIIVRDTTGHYATLNGVIDHHHLSDFNFDIKIRCKDFLALNIPMENASGFYGTAIADGVVSIKGPVDDITMDIDVLTKKGTEIDVPISSASSVNDNFIVFVKHNEESDTVIEKFIPEVAKEEDKYTINIDAQVTPDAEVNIFLPMNMGNISARGTGNLNLGVTNDDFTMRGDYLMSSGTFVFSLEMVKRTFSLRNGGTIRWTGDPTDADINLVGVYRTKSSLTSLGTSAVDTTALTDNINVDCIIRLTDKLMNPTITFGIELPNVKDDTRSLVYSIIDTTNQGVMAQQVFSLMMLGSFSYAAESNVARLGTTAGYGVITSQLSNWLSQISKDFDVGINYTPNDRLTNEELEVALSTQLFDDRLVIEGNFGVIRGDKNTTNKANNIVGDVDITFKLTKRLSLKAYNHTNIKNNYYIYSFENYSDFTQGVGISYSQSFDNVREIFNIHRKNKNKR